MGGHLSQLEINVEDTASVLMECDYEEKKIPVSIQTNFIQAPPVRTCYIIGEDGQIFLDLINHRISLTKRITGETELHEFKDLTRNQLFIDELKHFLKCVSGKVLPAVSIKASLASLQMALAARKSIETGECIRLR
jgi:predicted dehydrogenase